MYVGFDTRFFELAADILDLGLVRKSTKLHNKTLGGGLAGRWFGRVG